MTGLLDELARPRTGGSEAPDRRSTSDGSARISSWTAAVRVETRGLPESPRQQNEGLASLLGPLRRPERLAVEGAGRVGLPLDELRLLALPNLAREARLPSRREELTSGRVVVPGRNQPSAFDPRHQHGRRVLVEALGRRASLVGPGAKLLLADLLEPPEQAHRDPVGLPLLLLEAASLPELALLANDAHAQERQHAARPSRARSSRLTIRRFWREDIGCSSSPF